MQYYCSIRREGAVVAAVFRPVVFYMLFFKFIAEPYKFSDHKKINGYSRAYRTLHHERNVKSISVKTTLFNEEFSKVRFHAVLTCVSVMCCL